MKFGCSNIFFLNTINLICRSTDISSVFEGPFDFEITRVDCSYVGHVIRCNKRELSIVHGFYSIMYILLNISKCLNQSSR